MKYVGGNSKGKIEEQFGWNLMYGTIGFFGSRKSMKIMQLFEFLVEKKIIYFMVNDYFNAPSIDLHKLQWCVIQWLLDYAFRFKLDEILEKCPNGLVLIVGRGNHSVIKNIGDSVLKKFVRNELESYTPPIVCHGHERNIGSLIIERKYLIRYAYAKNKGNADK
eukprot:UN05675